MAEPWTIDWFICRMDQNDVNRAKSEGNKTAKVGDELWRVPLTIGPITIDHNHWAGWCLEGEPRDWRLAASAPVLLDLLKKVVAAEYIPLDDVLKKWVVDLIQHIEGDGQ